MARVWSPLSRVVFGHLDKTRYSTLSLHPGVWVGTGDHNAGGEGGGWRKFAMSASFPPDDPAGSSNIPSHFMLRKPELSTGAGGPLGS